MDDLLKSTDIAKIAEEGAKIYSEIKYKYEPADNGKFLAIDIDSKEVFIANSSSEAVALAKVKHPEKVFYVVKIGSSAVEILAHLTAIASA
ncbi:hypothetical protein C4568_01630 [Candidatus Parcubacteria bacterium]|nr:MAG: hypothetical protein C4568_01630 [Candidatus Parcubacteria bacterium]